MSKFVSLISLWILGTALFACSAASERSAPGSAGSESASSSSSSSSGAGGSGPSTASSSSSSSSGLPTSSSSSSSTGSSSSSSGGSSSSSSSSSSTSGGLTTVWVPVTDGGLWTHAPFATVTSVTQENFQFGDCYAVFGSSIGTEPSATDGTNVASVCFDQSGLTVSPIPKYWTAYPYYRLSQEGAGSAPTAKIAINGI
jgi:hypothetical protein